MPRPSPPSRTPQLLWGIAPVLALCFVLWADAARVARVQALSALPGRARTTDSVDARSPTGYAGGQRELLVAEANEASFGWIAETQQMIATGSARIRHFDSENAPQGRGVGSPSPYRWWLGLLAWAHHGATGAPTGLSVEWAALYGDPALHVLVLLGACALAGLAWGARAMAVVSLGVAGFFPFAADFLPGMPGSHGLADGFALVAILLALMGASRLGARGEPKPGAIYPWFALAGIAGALGLWVEARTLVPVTLGIFIGALLAAWLRRRMGTTTEESARASRAWRIWGYAGGATVLAAYLAEYFPSDMGALGLGAVHPAHGLAWVCASELAALAWSFPAPAAPSLRGKVKLLLAVAGLAAVPVAIVWTGSWSFLVQDLSWAALCRLPGSPLAASTGAWLLHDAVTPGVGAAFLPLVAALVACAAALRPRSDPATRVILAIALGPVLVAAAFACRELAWWSTLDTAALAALAALFANRDAPGWGVPRALAAAALLGAVGLGAAELAPTRDRGPDVALTQRESQALIERHLAHWLATRAGEAGSIVYAPPDMTPGIWFYGGLRGIGSFSPDNRTGFGAALNIAAALNMEEAQNGLAARGVRFVVVPSFDPFFDEFAKRYLDPRFAGRPNFFAGELRKLNLPPWLRPIPYQMPVGGGFEGQSVLVFEVVEDQAPAVAAGRIAEYLVEMGDLDRAAAAAEQLRKFPGDVGALSARIEVQLARGDTPGASATLEALLARLGSGADRYLPWDRRVSLALVLAQAGRVEQARAQVERCLREASDPRLRSLTTGSLFNLLVIAHALRLEFQDPGLRDLALDLLPGDLRNRL